MALVRCKSCGTTLATGCMPTATCGLLLLPALLLAAILPLLLWSRLRWYALLLPVPVFFATVLAIHVIPYTIEYLCVLPRPCPTCRARRWSFPFHPGLRPLTSTPSPG